MPKQKADLSKMRCEIRYYTDDWQQIKDSALFTIHKGSGKYPTDDWKKKILLAEHSPIREGKIVIDIYDVPSFVITHYVRHHNGVEKFVATFRSDRVDYDEVPNRNTLQNVRLSINFQAFINISRKRFCNAASYETRMVWKMIMDAVKEKDEALYFACVPECVYRGSCPEMFPCDCDGTGGTLFGKFVKYVYENGNNLEVLFNIRKRYELYHKFVEDGGRDYELRRGEK